MCVASRLIGFSRYPRSGKKREPFPHCAPVRTPMIHVCSQVEKNMVFNALHAARMRGGRDGEHAWAAAVNAGGEGRRGSIDPSWSALLAPRAYTTTAKIKVSHTHTSLSLLAYRYITVR